jgi:hypothetical protein
MLNVCKNALLTRLCSLCPLLKMTSPILALDEGGAGLSWRMGIQEETQFSATYADEKIVSDKMLAPTPFLSPPENESMQLIDIGANLMDPQFLGIYHEKQRHEPDLRLVLERAASQVVLK